MFLNLRFGLLGLVVIASVGCASETCDDSECQNADEIRTAILNEWETEPEERREGVGPCAPAEGQYVKACTLWLEAKEACDASACD